MTAMRQDRRAGRSSALVVWTITFMVATRARSQGLEVLPSWRRLVLPGALVAALESHRKKSRTGLLPTTKNRGK
jgi:hypothetical protein